MSEIISLAASVVALAVSIVVAWRQDRQSRSAVDFAAVLEIYLRDVRNKDYQNDMHYVVTRLRSDHPQDGIPVSRLPERERNAVWNVAFLYESIGVMYELGAINRRIALGLFHFRIIQVWEAIVPYVRAEREYRDGPFLAYFEKLYAEAQSSHPSTASRVQGRTVRTHAPGPQV
ncbi:hypothetical protein VSR01_05220 [Actinacidiphila sp. DG2A-62]|uniref:DUF4760 domain-containing protein n=1 Tax=Actinacidiphila sp. DG2A-62 TaxID=3108821 RepID=UPI002DBA6DAD|nr:hypothetical protein [Actinacidiphila sp. DG2A-62]MEC3992978.1 hypothetical protein [Actinacidiphila sp. DG2A-62]